MSSWLSQSLNRLNQSGLLYTLGLSVIAVAGSIYLLRTSRYLSRKAITTSTTTSRLSNQSASSSSTRSIKVVRPPLPSTYAVSAETGKSVKFNEPSTFSNIDECQVYHIHLDLTADFTFQVLKGSALYSIDVLKPGVSSVVLDTRDITIKQVMISGIQPQSQPETKEQVEAAAKKAFHAEKVQNIYTDFSVDGLAFPPRKAEYSLHSPHKVFGSALHIQIPEALRETKTILLVKIEYETAPGSKCSSLQWLSPAQTLGKVYPYLFSQNQAIHCRSMLPCQDAPAVKQTYTANITVPYPLVALMSAIDTGALERSEENKKHNTITYTFQQNIPISAYLIAIAAGQLESRDIGPRSKVWSEPGAVDAGAYEFAETESFIATGEELFGPYVWGRYDLLLLPPSFPYGGMENPCLTFVTPTLISGDRSLVDVVAHEISHSWFGNLVTNCTWGDFWMNEGFTVFAERKIISRIYGVQKAGLKSTIGWRNLNKTIKDMGETHEFTKLCIDMKEVDPDDSFSNVPYEKGYAFLCYLENLMGGPAVFEPFIRGYVLRFRFGVVDAVDFRKFFEAYFSMDPNVTNVKWDEWLKNPGIPPAKPIVDVSLVTTAELLAGQWFSAVSSKSYPTKKGDTLGCDSIVLFLEKLLELRSENSTVFGAAYLDELDKSFGFTKTKNCEIKFKWVILCSKRKMHKNSFTDQNSFSILLQ